MAGGMKQVFAGGKVGRLSREGRIGRGAGVGGVGSLRDMGCVDSRGTTMQVSGRAAIRKGFDVKTRGINAHCEKRP